jgi:hypothetical protein
VLNELGHEVIVAHARHVRLIGKSRRKDDRFDARTWLGWHGSIPSCWRRFGTNNRNHFFASLL